MKQMIRFTKGGATEMVKVGFSWPGLVSGPFHLVYRGMTTQFFLWLMLDIFSCWIAWIFVYPFMANSIYRRYLINNGWQQIGSEIIESRSSGFITALIIILLFIIPPVGIPLLWFCTPMNKNLKWGLSVFGACWFLIILVAAISKSPASNTRTSARKESACPRVEKGKIAINLETGEEIVGTEEPASSVSSAHNQSPPSEANQSIIAEFCGAGGRNTRPFVTTGPWEIQWYANGEIFQLYLFSADGVFEGIAANQERPGKGTSYQPTAGRYYLQVNATEDWTIKIISAK